MSFVQAVEGVSNVITMSPTAGNSLIVASQTSTGGGTPTLTSVISNNAISLSARVATFQNTYGRWVTIYDIFNIPSGITSLTGTFNGGSPGTLQMIGIEYSGLTSFIVGSNNAQQFPGLGADALTSGAPVSVGTAPALILGVVSTPSGNGDTTAGTGFSNRHAGGSNWLVCDQTLVAPGTAQVLASAPVHGTTDDYETFLLAYALQTGIFMPWVTA